MSGALALFDAGFPGPVAGVDEVGRGPLAGPVVAAAVILPPGFDPAGIDDSKRLSPTARAREAARIWEAAAVGIGSADTDEIDRLNIHGATLLAMARAVRALPVRPAHVLVDGKFLPRLDCSGTAVVGGDRTSLSVAAASIVAKVRRDRIMVAAAADHPAYGWALNKGYPAPHHLRALAEHGPTPFHRRSFAPVARAYLAR